MKKLVAILMSLSMMLAVGCGKQEAGADATKADANTGKEAAATTDKPADKAAGKTKIKVVYKQVDGYKEWLEAAKAEYEKAYPDMEVELSQISSNEGDYNTKTALMLQTDDTVDVMVVDSFLVPSLVGPGYLKDLAVDGWADWKDQYSDSVKAGMTIDGKVYAIPYTTDTRGLYYNVEVFKKAGVETPWAPKSWDDVLKTVKKLQDAGIAYPIWMNGSKAQGEGTTMQTFEMLMAGTGDWIFEDNKWVAKAPGITDTLKFIQSVYEMGVYDNTELGTMLDANGWQTLNVKMPESKEVGILLDGSWKSGDWFKALPDTAADVIKITPLPNQKGDNFASMSGGWTLGVSALSDQAEASFNFIQAAANKNNILSFTTKGGDMAVRKDVVSDDTYVKQNVYRAEMSKYTDFTKFRPGVELYPSISIEIQTVVEAVITGQMTAEEAAEAYDKNVKELAGEGNWVEK